MLSEAVSCENLWTKLKVLQKWEEDKALGLRLTSEGWGDKGFELRAS